MLSLPRSLTRSAHSLAPSLPRAPQVRRREREKPVTKPNALETVLLWLSDDDTAPAARVLCREVCLRESEEERGRGRRERESERARERESERAGERESERARGQESE